MKVKAKYPLRYKGVRYEIEEIFEIDSEDITFLEPYVEFESEKPEKNTNKKNVSNSNRRNNEDTATSTKDLN